MKIEVLGMGCMKCRRLHDNVKEALELSGKEADISKITDLATITEYGVMSTPALAVDGKVVSSGKVMTPEEIQSVLP